MDWSIYIIVWIVCGIAALLIAQNRGATNTITWFAVGVLLGPIGVVLAIIGAKGPRAAMPVSAGNVADELSKLVALRNAGELSQAEFDQQRARLMGGPPRDPNAVPGWRQPTAPSPVASSWSATAASSPIVTATAKEGRSGAETLVIGLILVAIVIGGILVLNGGRVPGTSTTTTGAGIPPAGTIWFGDSFDTDTYVIRGRKTVVGATEPFSFVAHLARSMDASALAIRAYYENSLVTSQAVDASGSSDVWGFSPGPLFVAGEWRYEMIELGGGVLASGTITATE